MFLHFHFALNLPKIYSQFYLEAIQSSGHCLALLPLSPSGRQGDFKEPEHWDHLPGSDRYHKHAHLSSLLRASLSVSVFIS